MLTYLCKYTPIELLAGFGTTLESPNEEVPDYTYADTVIHPSICGHARMLITAMRDLKEKQNASNAGTDRTSTPVCPCTNCDRDASSPELILTNCCDSIRRVWDTSGTDGFAFSAMLDLPHRTGGHAVAQYMAELKRLADSYAASTGRSFDRARFLTAWHKAADAWAALPEKLQRGPYLLLLGARTGDLLNVRLRDGLSLPIVDLTCGGIRTLPVPPENAASLSDDALLTAYAEALLSQLPCLRMEDVESRSAVLRNKNLAGIIYHTVRFCDYYPFEYAKLRRSTSIPMLKLESDYTDQSSGQLSTRIAAFEESLHNHPTTSSEKAGQNMNEHALYIGIDSGSTTTNIAAVDRKGNLVDSLIIRTGAKASSAAERALTGLRDKLGSRSSDIASITATGYGREFISFADHTKTEISCHARGARYLHPEARTIIDIGGQDSKIICLDEDGAVSNFIMNDKCAAGTGRFLEMMAATLEMRLSDMARKGLSWKKDLTISSTCTVFAESEVVSLIAENHDTGDIIHALNKSVASKTCAMVKRSRGSGPYMMTGGVARNPGVVKEIETRLGEPVFISETPDLAGAIGAALFARDEAQA